jgi:exodeoxyribonuclease V beta subunit
MLPLDPDTVPLTGTHLIEASAGTGKTYTITTLVLRLLLEQGLEVEDLLIVTFTRAATAELRDRVWGRLRVARAAFDRAAREPGAPPSKDPSIRKLVERLDVESARARLTRAMQGFDRATISTIHGFCQRMLQENAFESGAPFQAELVGDDAALRREIARDHWARAVHAASPALVRRLQDRKIGPDAMLDLVSAGVRSAEARLVPDPETLPAVDAAALQDAESAVAEAHARAAAIWAAEEPAVRALLAAAGGLNKRKYGDIPGKLDHLGAALAAPAGPLDAQGDKAVTMFSASGLSAGTNKGKTTPEHPLFDALDDLLEVHAELVAALDLQIEHLRVGMVQHARAELPRRKQARAVWSYDDLLVQLRDALDAGPGCALARRIRGRYKAALIDEFQDTDPVQYGVFRTVWAGQAGHALFLIGDPKQAIYAFRGADIHAYLAAGGEAADHAWTMTTNWRSDPGLLRGIEALHRRGERPFILPGIDFQHVGARPGAVDALRDADGRRMAPLEIGFLQREGRTGKGSASKRITKEHAVWHARATARVLSLLHGRVTLDGAPLRPGDIAILVRNRYQAADVQGALRAAHVPSVRQTDESVLDTAASGWLYALLAAARDPRDATRVRTALATPLWGRSAEQILALRDDEAGWVAELERLAEWKRQWEERGFTPAFRRMLADLRVPERALAWPDGERVMTDLLHLAELLQEAATVGARGPDALLRWFEDVRADERLREAEAGQLRLESDAEAVQILTIHKSKGLEFPVVLCPYLGGPSKLRDGDKARLRYHDPDADGALVLDIRDPKDPAKRPALELGERETFAESMRLLYVAVTRAAHRCEIFWGATVGFERSPFGHAMHPRGGDDPPAGTQKWLKSASDDALLAELEALVAAAEPGDIAIRLLDDEMPPPYRGKADAAPVLTARKARALPPGWSTSSFSRLASAGSGDERVADDEARDHDERAAAPAEPVVADGPPVPLDAFPRGARAGNLLHDVLEHADFAWRAGEGRLESLVTRMLTRYGQDAELWTEPLSQALDGVLGTPLGRAPGEPCLRDITRDARISEMEFILPVAHTDAGRALTPARLAAALRAHPGPGLPAGYADAVERLRFRELQGWMRGFVDLVYCWQGRWYVVDYKSNHLGGQAAGYLGAGLDAAMAHHHYVLQYHLYSVALHRALERRVAGYDPAEHFGGVRYLFLRGMAPDHAPGTGVFEDAPPPALLDALSRALAGEEA